MVSHLQYFLKILSIIFTFCVVSLHGQDSADEVSNFDFEGIERNYEVYLPQNFEPQMPLVISLHEYGKNIQKHKEYTLLHEAADTMGFIIVYPEAISLAWNIGVIDSWRVFLNINDVGFISALIDTMYRQYTVDLKRVYVCGFGSGGEMALRLGLDLSHRFAAVASVAGKLFDYPYAYDLHNFPSIPLMQIHGTGDTYAPYYETRGTMWIVPQTLNFWAEKNGCQLQVDTVSMPDLDQSDGCTVDKITYKDCGNNANIIHYKVLRGGCQWPGAPYVLARGPLTKDINANTEILNFFNNFENPMADLAYAKSKQVYPHYILPEGETVVITANISNPVNHSASVTAYIKGTTSAYSDSLQLFDDGLHNDGQASDNIWGAAKWLANLEQDIYNVTLSSTDLQNKISTHLFHPTNFTNMGPLEFDTSQFGFYNPDSNTHRFKVVLKNLGINYIAKDISARLKFNDQRIQKIAPTTASFGDIQAESSGSSRNVLILRYAEGYGPEDITKKDPLIVNFTIFSNYSHLWTDTYELVISIENQTSSVPVKYALKQNYPNPFNPITTIEYQLPKASQVDLSIYNLLGQKVATPVSAKQPAGTYKAEWDASTFASGIYFYRLETDQGFTTVRKLVVLK